MIKGLFALLVFLLGAFGGLWTQAAFLPYLAVTSPYKDWRFVQDWAAHTIVVEETTQIVIGERQGAEAMLEEVKNIVVGVVATRGLQSIESAGFIYASEGIVVSLAASVPQGFFYQVLLASGEIEEATVLKRDTQKNLALLKIGKDNLPTRRVNKDHELPLGMSVFSVGRFSVDEEMVEQAHEGIIQWVSENGKYQISIQSLDVLPGSPLFDLQGRIVGIMDIQKGKLFPLPRPFLSQFLEPIP